MFRRQSPKPRHGTLLPALAIVAALSPFGTDGYLAAFPAMSRDFSVAPAAIQLTLTAYLMGLGFGTLILGPISDGIGRRAFIVLGPLIFTTASAMCALSQGLTELTALRVAQGLAVAATVVAARAMVSDHYGAHTASRQFAIVIAGGHFAPLIAALLGGAALAIGDWRGVFWSMAGVGVIYTIVSVVLLPESLEVRDRHGKTAKEVWYRTRVILRHRPYVIVLSTSVLAISAHLAHVSSVSFVFQSVLGTGPTFFIIVFAVNAIGMVASNLLWAAFASRISAVTALRLAIGLGASASAVLLASAFFGTPPLAFVWGCSFVLASSMGVVLAATVALGQATGAPYQGTAAAIQGGLNFVAGAIVSPIPGLFGGQILISLSAIVLALLAAALWVFSRFHAAENLPPEIH